MSLFKLLCSTSLTRKLIARYFYTPAQATQVAGLSFRNKVGLGAGFDKNAEYLKELDVLGFGFIEIGTVTPLAQPGNPRPRVFRLKKDNALINRMGFNNHGVDKVVQRIAHWRKNAGEKSTMLIGGNIGKNKVTPNEDAWKDYEICFKALHHYVDFFIVNVSSPNTPGLRELQEVDSLRKILLNLQQLNKTQSTIKPIFLKIAPDLSNEQLIDIVSLAKEIKLDGVVATNTTIERGGLLEPHSNIEAIGAGGLSGIPVRKRSTQVISLLHTHTQGAFPIIGSGGIFDAPSANEKLAAGASLIEVWTGFIYQGPSIVKNILRKL